MIKPEKRWQLLMVADDGRIIPFKRIKGIAVTLVILLILLGLACAGLGWKLKTEAGSHRQVHEKLLEAKAEAARYKREHEFITAELVLAEARMKKAGLPIPNRRVWSAEPVPESTVAASDVLPMVDTVADDDRQQELASANNALALPEKSPSPLTSAPEAQSPVVAKAASGALPEKTPITADPPLVALGELKIKHDTKKKVLQARFRVTNTGPRSSPVAGRCMVVLKGGLTTPETWLSLPEGALVNGVPDPGQGQVFKISRYINMKMTAVARTDPSAFTIATIYVFDTAGAVLLQSDIPIDLPAPVPEPKPEPVPTAAEPTADETEADDKTVPSADDPSSIETAAPATGTDSRKRY